MRHPKGAGGTGRCVRTPDLGLYICRGIVQELGGRIWCESPGRDQGSTFAFALRGGGVVGKA